MNTDIDLRDTTVLAAGRLKKTGEEYSLVRLSSKNTDQILALQEVAFADLTSDEMHYLKRKDHGWFDKHFADGNTVLGVVHKGHLVAQSIILNPTAENPKLGMTNMDLGDTPLETLTVLKGVIVDPAYRGNSLMGIMVDAWLTATQKNGRTEMIAEVAVENSFSWFVFLQKGLHIEGTGIDPEDGTGFYNLHGRLPALSQVFNDRAKKCPQTDFKRQKKLFTKGYKAAGFDPANGNLKFKKPKKNGHCL